MATPTNDEMYDILVVLYGPQRALGDMLTQYYSQYSGEFRASRQFYFYDYAGADGETVADLANDYWSDINNFYDPTIDYLFENIEHEDGTDFLMEDGSYVALEVGN
jgi:hypothetical protein